VFGTITEERLLLRDTAIWTGAWPFNVTVPVELVPPTTAVGLRVRLVGIRGVTANVALTDVADREAEMVAVVGCWTNCATAVNVVLTDPAGTLMTVGTVTLAWLLDKLTVAPPMGAGPFSVTIPIELAPPMRLVGLSVRLVGISGVMVKVALAEVEARTADIVALVWRWTS
jgi:hypothetical protein